MDLILYIGLYLIGCFFATIAGGFRNPYSYAGVRLYPVFLSFIGMFMYIFNIGVDPNKDK